LIKSSSPQNIEAVNTAIHHVQREMEKAKYPYILIDRMSDRLANLDRSINDGTTSSSKFQGYKNKKAEYLVRSPVAGAPG
jgi:hypothetical protein